MHAVNVKPMSAKLKAYCKKAECIGIAKIGNLKGITSFKSHLTQILQGLASLSVHILSSWRREYFDLTIGIMVLLHAKSPCSTNLLLNLIENFEFAKFESHATKCVK